MEEIVFLSGHLIPRSQAHISPFDYGFIYGYGLFETMRAYSGHIFRLEQHLARLDRSAKLLGLPAVTFDLEKASYDTIRANKLSDSRVRLTISAGEGEATPDLPSDLSLTVLISARSYSPHPAETYHKGFKAVVSTLRQNSQSPLSRIKSSNYLTNILARREARAVGADEALLLNERGFLAEGSTSNIFLVSIGGLLTPPEGSGLLPGITRQAVMELAAALGIEVREQEITLEELLQADEAFLTSSLLELMPLTEVNRQAIGSGKPRAVSQKLMAAYRELVAKETCGL